jgi:hypothetical protein
MNECRELDDGRILVLLRFRGRGKTSGLELGAVAKPGANLVDVHDGKVTRIVVYFDTDRAFADLGLSPEGHAGSS